MNKPEAYKDGLNLHRWHVEEDKTLIYRQTRGRMVDVDDRVFTFLCQDKLGPYKSQTVYRIIELRSRIAVATGPSAEEAIREAKYILAQFCDEDVERIIEEAVEKYYSEVKENEQTKGI